MAQFALFFGTAAVFMLQPIVAPGQIAAVFATFGILYALQVLSMISQLWNAIAVYPTPDLPSCARVASDSPALPRCMPDVRNRHCCVSMHLWKFRAHISSKRDGRCALPC